MKVQHASPAMREYIAAQLEHVAKLELQNTRHVREVPSDKSYIVREDAGIDLFSVLLRFPPGVDLMPGSSTAEDTRVDPLDYTPDIDR